MISRNSAHSVALLIVVGMLLAAEHSAKGTSIEFPKFSTPILQDNRLVFSSPDSMRLLCVNLDGKVMWQRDFESPIRLFSGPRGQALVQSGNVVRSVSSQTDELDILFTVEDEHDGVRFSNDLGEFVSQDLRFNERTLKLLDRKTGKPLWRTQEVERVICATPDVIVCMGAERITNGTGYRIGRASLDGYDRTNFEKKWSVPLSRDSGVPYPPTAFDAPYLVYLESRTSLAVLDCTNGRKRLTKSVRLPESGRIVDLEIHDGRLFWLTHAFNNKGFNISEYLLNFSSFPDLKEERSVALKVKEIARISFESGYVISDALYQTACFELDGDKIWEGAQMNRTPVIKHRLYFSDYSNSTARLGSVDVLTGKETILYTESTRQKSK